MGGTALIMRIFENRFKTVTCIVRSYTHIFKYINPLRLNTHL